MTAGSDKAVNRREFLKASAGVCAVFAGGLYANPAYGSRRKVSGGGKRVIVIGIDGMDPRLSQQLMDAGKLPNLDKLRRQGGYSVLGTSIPPQSPVAWANFINGAGPGSHGIFDFIHRHPERQCAPFFAMAETVAGEGYWEVGDYKLQLDFWPFNHKPPGTILRRQGTPFWDYLDSAKICSTFYDLPSNYPPSPSKYGHHRCLAGMGTPDMLGTYGTYQHFAEDGPLVTKDEGGGKRSMLVFENDSARARLVGPVNGFLKKPEDSTVDFIVHRDRYAKAAVIEIQKQKLVLKEGQWSRWIKLDFVMSTPAFVPDKHVSGIVRFYLQQVSPNFRLYASPINSNPSNSELKVTEPAGFIKDISGRLGLFYTTGFQEDHKALSNKVFTDEEFRVQADMVLQERMRLLEYALDNYDDGLLFFYFSSTDLQSHMFWWDSQAGHPTRSAADAKRYFGCIGELYQKMDSVVGDFLARYGDKAVIIVMSDHGFANFKRQFNLNTWLKENGYIYPPDAAGILKDVDWAKTRAYGLGINGLYVNLIGRERDGIVRTGQEYDGLVDELVSKLEAVQDSDGRTVIHKVHRANKDYRGSATALAPDLIVGYARDFRASWDTCLGDMKTPVLCDNDSAWSADHCADVAEVPGVLFCNRPIAADKPALIDLGPTILNEFGLQIPASMEGAGIFKS
jgi:predicted AlkP superfamily phosphohydrolase/phosphomutase